jgi:N-acetylglucosamine-6-phosphate deacetylase
MTALRIIGGRNAGGESITLGVAEGLITRDHDHGNVLDAGGLIVAPGFIDLQVNGSYGHDFTVAPETIWEVAARLPETGVTAFLPTIITAAPGAVDAARAVILNRPSGFRGAEPLGLHIEGPMISRTRHGTHPEEHLVERASARDWSRSGGVAMVTLAPELPGTTRATATLASRGVVVSLGHSDATAAQASVVADAGATFGTHVFNAMSSITSRSPGLAGFLLTDDRMRFGMINDEVHLDPRVVQMIWALAPDRVVLVTDAIAATGIGDGTYRLGDNEVTVDGNTTRNQRGGLAGSVLTLDRAVRNLIAITGCTVAQAIRAASTSPAEALDLDDRGSLDPGRKADLILLDERLDVVGTTVGGRVAFLREPGRVQGGLDVAP